MIPSESSILEIKSVHLATESSLLECNSSPFPNFTGIRIDKQVVDSGQATIYVGVHESSKCKVAVKVMHIADPNAKAAYREELETLMRLRHPNILRVITTFEKPQECIVTKWMEGGCLNEWLTDQRRMRQRPILWGEGGRNVARDIASGLQYLHGEGKVHRDLKSMNVLMSEDGTAVLADFGFAKSMDVSKASLQVATFQMGTVHWMSPEMIRDEAFSFASDMYAFGIIVWEINACQIPYSEFTKKRQLEDAVLAGERPPLSESWPVEARDLMKRCWCNDPSHRLSASKVVEILGGQREQQAKSMSTPADLKHSTQRAVQVPMIDFVGVRERILEMIEHVRCLINCGGENRRLFRGHVDMLKLLEELTLVLSKEGSKVCTPYCSFLFKNFENDLVMTNHVLEVWSVNPVAISSREHISRVQDMLQGMKEWWLRIGLVLQGVGKASAARAGTFTDYFLIENESARRFWMDNFSGRSEASWGEFRNTLLSEDFLSTLNDEELSRMIYWSKIELHADDQLQVNIETWEEFTKSGPWTKKLLELSKKSIPCETIAVASDSTLERLGISLGGSGLSKSRVQLVEIAVLMDCTSTMGKHLDDLANDIPSLIHKAKQIMPCAFLRIAFVGYRDIGDKKPLCVLPFVEQENLIISFINSEGQAGGGGGDAAEDVLGGLQRAADLEWSFGLSTVRRLIHIADAPSHGLVYHNFASRTKPPSWSEKPQKWDRFPNFDANGEIGLRLMTKLANAKIDYTFVEISSHARKMTSLFKKWYDMSPNFNLPMSIIPICDLGNLILQEVRRSIDVRLK